MTVIQATTSLRRTLALGLVAGSVGVTACGVSTQQEIDMGRQYAAEINRQLPIVTDPQVHRYINELGNLIQRQEGNRDIPYTFYVVNSEEINAFAVPGGFVYINRGLIERTDNLSELAGVLAHEIGHVEARHSAEMMERMQAAQVGVGLASILLGGPPSGLAGAAVDVGATAYFARHSREAENEADAIAVRLLPSAGIDPAGLVTFFKELIEERERTPSTLEQWFSTHPLTEERIANVRNLIQALPPQQNLAITSQTYQTFKQRVRSLPAPPAQFRNRD
ncbi:MAG: M48 family metalloprotease [Gemmatimonadetes bacterium]|nr:M48 family metalloprotease [Gemmatimonadota bacterium]